MLVKVVVVVAKQPSVKRERVVDKHLHCILW